MPTYTYQCHKCRKRLDEVKRIADRDDFPNCHGKMFRVCCAPMVAPRFNAYRTAALDKERGKLVDITSRDEHRAFLARNGYEEVGNDAAFAPPSAEQLEQSRRDQASEAVTYNFDVNTHEAT